MSKHQKTLEKIYEIPTRSDITFNEVESLLKSLGAKVLYGKGSGVKVKLKDLTAIFHRPHPRKEMDKGAISYIRSFLQDAGIELSDN